MKIDTFPKPLYKIKLPAFINHIYSIHNTENLPHNVKIGPTLIVFDFNEINKRNILIFHLYLFVQFEPKQIR